MTTKRPCGMSFKAICWDKAPKETIPKPTNGWKRQKNWVIIRSPSFTVSSCSIRVKNTMKMRLIISSMPPTRVCLWRTV